MSLKIMQVTLAFFVIVISSSCEFSTKQKEQALTAEEMIAKKSIAIDSSKIAYSFDFPVGKPDAKGYYNYQGFAKNNHLGEDWNGVGGGNSDLGDTIYAIGNGIVTYAEDFKDRWGNTVRIIHELPDGARYESIYTHCDTLLTSKSFWVLKGEPIGTIGTAHGQFYAHLHLELREEIGLPIGNGYSADTTGYVNPTVFNRSHRKMVVVQDSISTVN